MRISLKETAPIGLGTFFIMVPVPFALNMSLNILTFGSVV